MDGELAELRAERDVLDEKIKLLERYAATRKQVQEHDADVRALDAFAERLRRAPNGWLAEMPLRGYGMNAEAFGIGSATFRFVSDNRDNIILTDRGPVISLVDLLPPPRASINRYVDHTRLLQIYEAVRAGFAFPLRLALVRQYDDDSTYVRLKDGPHTSMFQCDDRGNATITVSYTM